MGWAAYRHGFWTGGRKENRKALEEQLTERLDVLQTNLNHATEPEELTRLRVEIRKLKKALRKLRNEADDLLF